MDSYYVDEDESLSDASDRIKKILDAKYEPADTDDIMQEQKELTEE